MKFQAWADSHVNFPYHVRAPLEIFVKVLFLQNLADVLAEFRENKTLT